MKRILASSSVLSLVIACSGSDSTNDGGGDAALADGAVSDAPNGDMDATMDAPADGGPSDYCSALASYHARCNLNTACDIAILAACAARSQVYTDAAKAAYVACVSLDPCPGDAGGGRKAFDDCYLPKLAGGAAADKLATDFCALCDPKMPNCAKGFYGRPDAGMYGPGDRFLQYTDKVLMAIDAQCAQKSDAGDGGVASCTVAFDDCARRVEREQMGGAPAACKDM